MSLHAMVDELPGPAGPGLSHIAAAMSPADMAELLSAFNDATARLQAAHESLGAEVMRLRNELGEANRELERSRRLAALGEMAAGIAHEIRNPLGSIGLYARMLEADLARAGDRPGEAELAARIAVAVRTVDAVVRDVLAFAGDARVRPEPVVVADLLDRALQEAVAAVPTGAAVHRSREAEAATEVSVDPSLMHRALVNILCNALQAMQEQQDREPGRAPGALTIECGRLSPADPGRAGEVRTDRVWIRVTDTGPGIAPEVMDRIFNPFFTTRATGTGLGLAIVHRIVDAHGGRIAVRNIEGRGGTPGGAAVEIELPGAVSAPVVRPVDGSIGTGSRHRRRGIAAAARS